MPDDVKVIVFDANSNNEGMGGNDKNFNLKNSGVGTYGIALYTEGLEKMCNTVGSLFNVAYTDYPALACWVTLDLSDQLMHIPDSNRTYCFTWDFMGYGAKDRNVSNGVLLDARRHLPLEVNCARGDTDSPATPGRLTPLQKMTLGFDMEAGETVDLRRIELYIPDVGDGEAEGLLVNGELYGKNAVLTLEAAGKYTLDFKYKNDGKLTARDTDTRELTTETRPDDTDIREEPDDTEVQGSSCRGGCSSSVFSALPMLALALASLWRREE